MSVRILFFIFFMAIDCIAISIDNFDTLVIDDENQFNFSVQFEVTAKFPLGDYSYRCNATYVDLSSIDPIIDYYLPGFITSRHCITDKENNIISFASPKSIRILNKNGELIRTVSISSYHCADGRKLLQDVCFLIARYTIDEKIIKPARMRILTEYDYRQLSASKQSLYFVGYHPGFKDKENYELYNQLNIHNVQNYRTIQNCPAKIYEDLMVNEAGASIIYYDCSSLQQSSGAGIFIVENGEFVLIGVHKGYSYEAESNFAVLVPASNLIVQL